MRNILIVAAVTSLLASCASAPQHSDRLDQARAAAVWTASFGIASERNAELVFVKAHYERGLRQ